MKKKVPEILKIQAFIRGVVCRQRNAAIVASIRKDSIKKTKKYQAAAKIQGLVRGFLFRQKRKKALAKLNTDKNKDKDKSIDDFDDEMEDFDAEAFFGVKEENLNNKGLSLPEEAMMQQMI